MPNEEIIKLEEEIKKLKEENEYLKKRVNHLKIFMYKYWDKLWEEKIMKINILGTEYTLEYKSDNTDLKLKEEELDGYCDCNEKTIVISDSCYNEERVVIHELTHAFLYESGLWEESYDEKLVNWISIQINKIFNSKEEVLKNSVQTKKDVI